MTSQLRRGDSQLFLSTLTADRYDTRLAAGVVILSAIVFACAVPFARAQLAPIFAFIPVYEAALVITDLFTAALLFGQFSLLKSRGLAILASGYLFTASVAIAHLLSFPGAFSPTGLLGAGPQTTAWLYMFWHAGFPLLVCAYSLTDRLPQAEDALPNVAVTTGVVAAIALVGAGVVTLVATAGHDVLPAVMQGNRYTPAMIIVVSTVWMMSAVALLLLWRRRPRTVLDLWLMVVMCAWIFDIALSAVLNAGRYDVGFYAGRIYGFGASSFVLLVLLLQSGALYERLVSTHRALTQRSAELEAANKELDAFTYSVSHDLRAPLRAADGYASMLEEDYADKLDAEGKRLIGVVRTSSQKMGQLIDELLAFSRLGRTEVKTRSIAMDPLVRQVIEDLSSEMQGRAIEFTVASLGYAKADPELLKHVIANLVSNAIKFTRDKDPARVEIGCSIGNVPESVVFYVKDNGAGFEMKYYDKLFGVFQRLHTASEYPGTGVGLAIVQRVIHRHGGKVWAEGAPGEGATFYFTLSRAVASLPARSSSGMPARTVTPLRA